MYQVETEKHYRISYYWIIMYVLSSLFSSIICYIIYKATCGSLCDSVIVGTDGVMMSSSNIVFRARIMSIGSVILLLMLIFSHLYLFTAFIKILKVSRFILPLTTIIVLCFGMTWWTTSLIYQFSVEVLVVLFLPAIILPAFLLGRQYNLIVSKFFHPDLNKLFGLSTYFPIGSISCWSIFCLIAFINPLDIKVVLLGWITGWSCMGLITFPSAKRLFAYQGRFHS